MIPVERTLLRLFQRRFDKHLCQTGLGCGESLYAVLGYVCRMRFCLETSVINRNKMLFFLVGFVMHLGVPVGISTVVLTLNRFSYL